MKRFLWLLLILAIAIFIGFWIHEVQGFVLFQLQDFSIAMPMALALLAVLLGTILLVAVWHLLVWIFSAPQQVRRYLQRNRQKQQQKSLQEGLTGWLLEDWPLMERSFKKLGVLEWTPKLSWLLTAKAIQLQQQPVLQKDYLTKALKTPGFPEHGIAELIEIDELIAQQKWAEARLRLDQLKIDNLKPEWIAKRRLRLCLATQEWHAAFAPLKILHKARQISLNQSHQYSLQIYQGIVTQAHSIDVLAAAWQDIPSTFQQDPTLLACYAQQLLKAHHSEVAEVLLRKFLKTHWDETLFLLYCQSMGKDTAKQMECADAWFKTTPPTQITLMAMGQLCAHQQLLGRAKHYYQASIQISPSAAAYRALAEIYAREKQLGEAVEAYEKATALMNH